MTICRGLASARCQLLISMYYHILAYGVYMNNTIIHSIPRFTRGRGRILWRAAHLLAHLLAARPTCWPLAGGSLPPRTD